MARSFHNDVPDALLDEIALADLMVACSAEPTTRTEAVTTFALADVAMTPGDGNDYTIADGDTSGRKVTVAAKSSVTIDASGDATHIALCDGSRLIFVTTCGTLTLTSPGTVNFPAWAVEARDPAAP